MFKNNNQQRKEPDGCVCLVSKLFIVPRLQLRVGWCIKIMITHCKCNVWWARWTCLFSLSLGDHPSWPAVYVCNTSSCIFPLLTLGTLLGSNISRSTFFQSNRQILLLQTIMMMNKRSLSRHHRIV